ncbi:MAG TPA: serine hydrolase [Gammaproteobacteria bacterium]|nr:serine hydrolase [Gammaproteobacteria bacterium]
MNALAQHVRSARGLAAWALFLLAHAALAVDYSPPRGQWGAADPADAGFDPDRLGAAVEWARANAVAEPADLREIITAHFAPREPGFRIFGPTGTRDADSGMILRHGKLVAHWGDTRRVDMTFSVAKSYLSTLAALALADGLIADLDEPVARYVTGGHFAGAHNGRITWRHLLNQSSDWSGTLWDIPDWADRPEGEDPEQRPLHPPGTRYKYNDVRVNLLALSLLELFREPLPQVLKRRIMDPIGASTTWRWHGYENSWVDLDGLKMQSVSGGGHFGGGLFISTEDHARFGLLFLRGGRWGDEQLFPAEWLEAIRTPAPGRADYGYLWWLNPERARIPAAPERAFAAAGFGGHHIYVDEQHDLVIVLRWIPDLAGVVERVLGALE